MRSIVILNGMKMGRTIKVMVLVAIALCVTGCICLSSLFGRDKANKGEIRNEYPELVQNLKKHVEYLTADCYPRSVINKANQAKACAYICSEFEKIGVSVRKQEVKVNDDTFENLVAVIPGEVEDVLVIGAHYDSYDMTPGADDNASGIAGVIELCRLLARCKTKYTIELVAFCNEEPPYFRSIHMGSVHHADSLELEKKKVIGMICLEMIGFFSDEESSQDYPLDMLKHIYPSTGNFLAVVGNWHGSTFTKSVYKEMSEATALPIVYLVTPNIQGITLDYSDHRSYWAKNYPAVMVTDTAFYRNNNYHQLTDTSDSLDYVRMSLGVWGIYCAVKRISEAKESP